jgi:hypothetical protein
MKAEPTQATSAHGACNTRMAPPDEMAHADLCAHSAARPSGESTGMTGGFEPASSERWMSVQGRDVEFVNSTTSHSFGA